MERRQVGDAGVEVSRVILGLRQLRRNRLRAGVLRSGRGRGRRVPHHGTRPWELGITTFDTADAYGGGQSETMIGEWIASRGVRPEIVTKTFNPMGEGQDQRARPYPDRAADRIEPRPSSASNGIDLYLAHEFDPGVPLAETIATLRGDWSSSS